jgi:hypothetical protein
LALAIALHKKTPEVGLAEVGYEKDSNGFRGVLARCGS